MTLLASGRSFFIFRNFFKVMLTLEQCRKIDPSTASLSDEELLTLLHDYSEIAQLAFESWMEVRGGSKNPEKVLSNQS